jgi:bifunctional non-homologous end joining protein LigD
MSLREYHRKRDFTKTAEPEGGGEKRHAKKRFVIQKHDASRLHYDFRLELHGTLVSWAVPKGLPLTKGEKHLAVKVEDHPISYIDFEGTIPKGQYGGGTVQVWDKGTYEVQQTDNAAKELEKGKLHFTLHGAKLNGEWYLVRLRDEDQWLIINACEDHKKLGKAREEKSAASGKTLAQIAKGDRVWNSKRSGGDSNGELKSAASPSKKKIALSRPKPVAKKRASGKKAKFIVPMMARLLAAPPPGDWQYEIKFDGFRALAYKDGDAVEVLSRNNHDLAEKFPEVAETIPSLRAEEAIVDGEIVALDEDGRSSFQLLQAYALGQEKPPLCYYVFDLLSLDGKSVRDLPLEERRKKLEAILPRKQDVIRYSSSLGSDAPALLKKAAKLGLEGLIGKRAGSLYEAGKRTGTWIKLKLVKEQEFVIGGYTDPGGSRKHFGALLVGVHQKGKLVYAGKVGTGFNEALLKELSRRFKPLATEVCPFSDLPERRQGRYGQSITASQMKKCHWLKPSLVCQLKFTEWTDDGRLRHPAFMGMREDKSAKDVIREPVENPS